MAAFCDFNVNCGDKRENIDLLKTARKLGYDCIAINYSVPDFLEMGKKVKHQNILSPEEILPDTSVIQNIQDTGRPLQIISRFTTKLTDNINSTKLNTPEIQAFDLLAVQPSSDLLFHNACSVLEIDIISLDLTERLPFFVKKSSINLALERGIYFEIIYSPAIRDRSMRRNILCNARDIIRISKGKNVIITSGAEKALELRGPYDVANLAQLFGMTFNQAKDAVSRNCRALLKHSESRKAVKSTMSFKRLVPMETKSSEVDTHKSQKRQANTETDSKKMKKQKVSQKS